MSTTSIIVSRYTHTPTGVAYKIRYRKADKMHFAMVGQVEVNGASFDQCLERVKKACDEASPVVWTPAIFVTNSAAHGHLEVSRYEISINRNGNMSTCDWEIRTDPYGSYPGVKHEDMTDRLRAAHANTYGAARVYAHELMAAITAGHPYRVGTRKLGDSKHCVWFPYSEGLWQALMDAVRIQTNFSGCVLDFLCDRSNMEEAATLGVSPYKTYESVHPKITQT